MGSGTSARGHVGSCQPCGPVVDTSCCLADLEESTRLGQLESAPALECKLYRTRLQPVAKKVMYLRARKRRSRLEGCWMEGLFFGVQDHSHEIVIGTRDGVIKGRTVRRVDGVWTTDAELVRVMRGTPWDPIPGNLEEAEVSIEIVPLGSSVPAFDLLVMRELEARNLSVKRGDIEKYGMAPSCSLDSVSSRH